MMPLSFSAAQRHFKSDEIRDLAADREGLRYLKLRSLNRLEHLKGLFESSGIPIVGSPTAEQLFQRAFEEPISESDIDRYVRAAYSAGRGIRKSAEPDLINQLYKLSEFRWGGLHQNSLEKTIVDNYVKKITSFDALCDAIENDLQNRLRGYVLCSWYNHWTSIIIEDIFRDHEAVFPAIGQVRKIDFFVRNVPYDLKVTYLPEGYLADKRREAGQRPEVTLLKQTARRFSVPFTEVASNSDLVEDLWQKLEDHPSQDCQSLIMQLRAFRDNIVSEISGNPESLIRWLYEQQGVRRFDASNRLFLVLVDQRNYFGSWKLKRARDLLTDRISSYLDQPRAGHGHSISFRWEGATYEVTSDVLLITHHPH